MVLINELPAPVLLIEDIFPSYIISICEKNDGRSEEKIFTMCKAGTTFCDCFNLVGQSLYDRSL